MVMIDPFAGEAPRLGTFDATVREWVELEGRNHDRPIHHFQFLTWPHRD